MENTISILTIENAFKDCFEKAANIINIRSWKIQPTTIGLDTHKSSYGRVLKSGEILINPAFIGTKAFNKLTATINHELAHLVVGLDENHNKSFKRVESHFNDGLIVPILEHEMVKVENGYKHRLLGFSQDKTYCLGGVFKRTKKYLDYDPQGKRKMFFKKDKLLRFEYVDYKAPLPTGTLTDLNAF